MRAAVFRFAALGWCGYAVGCGDGATGPDEQAQVPVVPATPTVAFSSRVAAAPEGGTAVLRLAVAPSSESPITVGYSIGIDDDAGTDDADSADYSGDPDGMVRISAGDTIGTIELDINDDDDIEPAREILAVTLHAPDAGAGFVLGSPDTAMVLIEEGVCDRTPRIRDEILRAAGLGHCLESNREDLAGIVDLELCNREDWPLCQREDAVIPELRQGDFQGLSQLERLTLAGVGLTDLPEGVFSGLSGLQTLWLANNRLTLLPERVLSGLSTLGSLSLAGNQLTELPAGLFSGLSSLWWLELSGNPINELPSGIFRGLSNLSGLVLVNTALGELPSDFLVGLGKLHTLDLRANPGSPFGLPVHPVRVDDTDLAAPGPADVAVQVAQGAPFAMEAILFIEGVNLWVDTLDIETGSALSTIRTVTHDSASMRGTSVTVLSVSTMPEDIRGVVFDVADPIVLFARPSIALPARAGRMSHKEWRKQ